MIHLDKVLSLKEPIIFTSHTILLFSDSSRVTWHDSQLKIIIIYLLGPWRIFFLVHPLSKNKKQKTKNPKNIYALSYSLPLSLTPHSLLSKLSSDWHRRSEQLVFFVWGKENTPMLTEVLSTAGFSAPAAGGKKCLSFNQFGCFWYESCKRWETPANYLKKTAPCNFE